MIGDIQVRHDCSIRKSLSNLKRMRNHYITFLEPNIMDAISGSAQYRADKGHKMQNGIYSLV